MSKNKEVQCPSRFHSLDILRGIAALSVVFWHWQFFFFKGTVPENFYLESQPFYSIFYIFYTKKVEPVWVFFALSGFIFFALYSEQIKKRTMGIWNFSVLRFSRLYPLHFVTLIIVLILQQAMYYRYGSFAVFSYNDTYHFILNLFFASEWGFQKGLSFNAPVWSVSIEALLYLIFFVVCTITSASFLVVSILIISGLILMPVHGSLGTGVFFYFMGGMVYLIYQEIAIKGLLDKWKWEILLIPVFLIGLLYIKYDFVLEVWKTLRNLQIIGLREIVYGGLISIMILTLALIETKRGHFGKRISFIGNLCYSSYLIHFPLILVFMGIAGFIGIDVSFYYTKYSIIIFLVVLIILSTISFKFLEVPAQKFLRDKYLHK